MIKLKNPEDLKAPFDLVQFPSMGLFYKDKRAGVLVKYITGAEENILTAPNLSATGIAFNMAMDSLIMEEVAVEDLLVVDRNAILLYLRSTGYGDGYPVIITCPNCKESGKTEFSISSMTAKDIMQMPDEEGCFSYTMPRLKINDQPVIIRFAPLTVREETEMRNELEIHKMNPRALPIDITLRYKYQIKSINGNTSKEFIERLSSRFPLKDSADLREHIERMEPGINSKVRLNCEKCSHSFYEEYPITNDFLALTPEYKNVIWEEAFLLGHYSQGAISRTEAMSISTAERHWRLQRLSEENDKKAAAEKKAAESAGRKT